MRWSWNSLLAAVVIAVATRAALAVDPPSTSPADEPVRAARQVDPDVRAGRVERRHRSGEGQPRDAAALPEQHQRTK